MYMVGLYVPFNLLYFRVIFPDLVHFVKYVFFHSIDEYFVSVFRDPDYMILASIRTVGLFPGFHFYSIAKFRKKKT